MPFRPLLLAIVLLCPTYALAQQTSTTANSQPSTDQQDLGALQAELAKTEAERQRLADELENAADRADLEALNEQNVLLREQLASVEEFARSNHKEQQQKWFIIGGTTVALSLFVGWIFGRAGGRSKRSMWLN